MTITKMADGRIALDWEPDLKGSGGPFIVLTPEQWAAFWRELRKLDLR